MGPYDACGLGPGTVTFCMAMTAYGRRLKEICDFRHFTYIDDLVVQARSLRYREPRARTATYRKSAVPYLTRLLNNQ